MRDRTDDGLTDRPFLSEGETFRYGEISAISFRLSPAGGGSFAIYIPTEPVRPSSRALVSSAHSCLGERISMSDALRRHY